MKKSGDVTMPPKSGEPEKSQLARKVHRNKKRIPALLESLKVNNNKLARVLKERDRLRDTIKENANPEDGATVESLLRALAKSTEREAELESNLENKDEQIKTLEEKNYEQEVQIEEQDDENSRLKKELQDSNNKIQELQAELDSKKLQIKRLCNDVAELQKANDEFSKNIDALKKDNQEMTKENKVMKNDIEDLKSSMKDILGFFKTHGHEFRQQHHQQRASQQNQQIKPKMNNFVSTQSSENNSLAIQDVEINQYESNVAEGKRLSECVDKKRIPNEETISALPKSYKKQETSGTHALPIIPIQGKGITTQASAIKTQKKSPKNYEFN